jgi:hypothetical protein
LLSALTDEERAHYEWLIRGLIGGARRLVGVPGRETTLAQTLQALDDLFLDVIYLAAATQRNVDAEARRLERSLIEELLEAADYAPESSRSRASSASPAR